MLFCEVPPVNYPPFDLPQKKWKPINNFSSLLIHTVTASRVFEHISFRGKERAGAQIAFVTRGRRGDKHRSGIRFPKPSLTKSYVAREAHKDAIVVAGRVCVVSIARLPLLTDIVTGEEVIPQETSHGIFNPFFGQAKMISCPSHITLVFRRAGLEKAFENGHGSLQVIFSGRCPSLGLSGRPSRVWGPPGFVGVRPAAVVHAKLRPDDSESETDSPPSRKVRARSSA